MIIVEGPDGSGKSTLIERLGCEGRKFKALRAGVGSEDHGNWGGGDPAPIAYARQVLQALKDEREGHAGSIGGQGLEYCDRRIAFDRFHLSETVYGPILRGASGISPEEVTILERLLKARGVVTILCLPPAEVTMQTVTREGRERPAYQTIGFLRRSYRAWERLACEVQTERWTWPHGLIYDYTRDPNGPTLTVPSPCPPGVVGSPTARFLLVGERSNLPLDLPFFSMAESSGFLNRALWYSGAREEDLAFTNAMTSEGRPRDLRACILASTEFIVALGVEAHSALIDQGVMGAFPVFNVPHPQFWNRYHARNEAAYVDRFRDVWKAAA